MCANKVSSVSVFREQMIYFIDIDKHIRRLLVFHFVGFVRCNGKLAVAEVTVRVIF